MKNTTLLIVVSAALVLILLLATRNLILRPVDGKITSGFGNRVHPIQGGVKFHNGIDIAAPSGTPIKAAVSGIVSAKYYNALGGNSLVVSRFDGLQTGYAHLSGFNVKEGQKVKAGDIIGYVGSTGNSTGPHLHFTLRNRRGKHIDPQKRMI